MQSEQTLPASCRLRVLLHGPLAVSKRLSDGSWKPVTWGQSRIARTVFRRLLAAPGRRLSRGQLADDLWPENDGDAADASLQVAISLIRSAIGKDLVFTWDGGYEIAGQPLVWVDLDAAEMLLKAAENQGHTSLTALPDLEEALSYLERGVYLAEETGVWCYAVRKKSEDFLRQCRLWLAESYEGQDKLLQASLQYRELLQTMPPDEYALQRWIAMLHQQGETAEALKCYREVKASAEEQGFTLSSAIEQTIVSLNNSPDTALPSSKPMLAGIIGEEQEAGGQSVNYLRRQFLQSALAVACTTLTLSPYRLLQPEKRERLFASIASPSYLDKVVLDDFSEITRRYWKLSANTSFQLVNSLLGLFQDVVHLLNTSQISSVSQDLYSLSSEVAQLLGKTLSDLRDYPLALSYYTFALKAALEGHNRNLWAVSLGRMGLLLLSINQPQQTIALLEEAKMVSIQSKKIRCYHAVIEAEAYSHLNNLAACRSALEYAKNMSEDAFSEADPYATGFTKSRLASYEGSCYLRLHQPASALPVLAHAMKLIDPIAVRRQSRLFVYLGETHTLLGNTQQAYEYASQALGLTQQTHSLDILYQAQILRDHLFATGAISHVNDLDMQINEMQATINVTGEFHG